MFKNRRVLMTLVAIPALLAFSPRRAELAFSPAEGTTIRKTITTTAEVALDEMSLVMDGQEMDQAAGMELDMTESQTLVVVDTYVSMANGRPKVLRRTFEELIDESTQSMSMPQPMGDTETDSAGSSELEGKTVVFTLDSESGDYVASFPEDEKADEALLQGLEEDLDLRGFLPRGEVAVGESWDVEAESVRHILAPGGNLHIIDESTDQGPMGGGPEPSMSEMLGELSGRVTCTLEAMREEEGTSLAVIKVLIEVDSTNDLSEFVAEQLANAEKPEGMDMEMDVESMDIEFQYEGEGEILWDVKRGVLSKLLLNGEMTLINDTAMTMTMMGQSQSFEQSMVFAGTSTTVFDYDVQ
ncbi:MAG: hypothetical protein WD226_12525 [Planctomycetota bacterium]